MLLPSIVTSRYIPPIPDKETPGIGTSAEFSNVFVQSTFKASNFILNVTDGLDLHVFILIEISAYLPVANVVPHVTVVMPETMVLE